jgi:putative ATP-binding cassette transporter
MVQVGLEDTMRRVKGFDSVYDWPNILSAGEQQRLGFARLILARPKYVFLDEATTALDSASEARLYRIIETTTENHISVGYHITLAGYHGMILELLGNGEWLTKKSR